MYILIDSNNVVLTKSKTFTEVENGYQLDVIYPKAFGTVVEISDSLTVIPQRNKYENGKVVDNVDYIQSIEEQIQVAIDEYTEELIVGGIL